MDPPSGGNGQVGGALRVFVPGAATRSPDLDARIAARAPDILRSLRARVDRTAELPSTTGRTARGLQGLPRPSTGATDPGLGQLDPFSGQKGPPLVPGEVLLTLREDALDDVPRLSETAELERYGFEVKCFVGPSVVRVRFWDRDAPDRALSRDETLWVRDRIARHGSIELAEPNYVMHALATPDDEFYGAQWHYPQLNLPAAWDITTGSSEVVVAVIDDGINPHPDLDPRVIPGYDMIEDPQISGDGDGRDPTAHQVPFSQGTTSSWHGTHVAGTIGAASNNRVGLAGVDWNARLLPVRVLGLGGSGVLSDILAAMNWAAGIDVPGVPPNPNPAQVINMSLGGGDLVPVAQEVINDVVARGTVVVVAAGNENRDAGTTSFGGYENVIVVGATDYRGQRAPYSNFGMAVDVMAPGGDTAVDANADGYVDGVLSTYIDTSGQRAIFDFLDGTSMAAPHVAGVAALMKAVRPGITPAEVETILKQTANSTGRCPEGCGAGLVNAAAAVLEAQGGGGPARPPVLALGAERLNLGSASSGSISVFNAGGGELAWQATLQGAQGARLRIDGPASGTLGPAAATNLSISVDRAGLADGEYQGLLVVSSAGETARAAVLFRVGSVPDRDIGPVLVGAVAFDAAGEVVEGGGAEITAADGYRFSFNVDPGEWLIVAIADRNGNEVLDDGDYLGVYPTLGGPELVTVEDRATVSDVDFNLGPYTTEGEGAPPPCGDFRSCIEVCGGDPNCESQCTVAPECQTCFEGEVLACGNAQGCGSSFDCLCAACEPQLDACFGPLLCSEGGGGMMPGTGGGIGAACDEARPCAAPLGCDTSVAGGYCTRACTTPDDCLPGGVCVGAPDGLCFAGCAGSGICPRAQDICQPFETTAVCVPPGS